MLLAIDSLIWQLVFVAGFIIALIIAAQVIGRNAKKKKKRR
jgi:hypothetical protein